jgi:predicted  nucleic acid-binding Zn-ribbon protein
MPSPLIEKLLIVQDRDQRRLSLEAQLKAVPRDIAAVEQKIASEKGAIETAKSELKTLEAKKKSVESEITATEEKLARYRTQQLQVRKNDEYQALGHEIEATQAAVGALEEQELTVMYAIDEAKKKFAAAEAELKANIAGHETRIRTLREREVNMTAELKTAQADLATARQPVDQAAIRVYDRVAGRNMPAVVAIHGGKCGGCHLKVSSEVESQARGRGVNEAGMPALATCDQCGRIVYWE